MRLIKIDVVRLQPLQRISCSAQYIRLRQTLRARPHLETNLGGDDDPVASATLLEPGADDGFRFTATIARRESGVNISGVDEIKSSGDESIKQSEGRSLIRRPSKDVSTKRQRRDLQSRITQIAPFHSVLRFRIVRVPRSKRHLSSVWMYFHIRTGPAREAALASK